MHNGRVRSRVRPQHSIESSYEVATPAAVAAVRGTDYRVAVSSTVPTSMITEVLEGQVAVQQDGKEVLLNKGFAVKAIEGEPLGEQVNLLPRPKVDFNDPKAITYPYDFTWQPIQNAKTYRITVARGNTPVKSWVVEDAQASFSDFEAGEYIVSIRGLDANGIEGKDRQFVLTVQQQPSE